MTLRQGTVARWDAGGGALLLDDGSALDLPAGALDPRLRALHVGQRVTVRVVDGRVTAVALPGAVPGDGPPGAP